jgi:hypothetical protein
MRAGTAIIAVPSFPNEGLDGGQARRRAGLVVADVLLRREEELKTDSSV